MDRGAKAWVDAREKTAQATEGPRLMYHFGAPGFGFGAHPVASGMMVGRLIGRQAGTMEFHIARNTRDRYEFPAQLFSFTGNVVFANVTGARQLAHRMNHVRDVANHPERAVHAAALYVMGLIDEASHVLMARYREEVDPDAMADGLAWLSGELGPEALDKLLLTFVTEFPGTSVYNGVETAEKWLAGQTDGVSHREAALEEMMLLSMANRNAAFKPFEELFEDKGLAERTAYIRFQEKLPVYFASRPLVELEDEGPVSLFDLLLAPAAEAPLSLSEQLEAIRKKWKPLLGNALERFLEIAGEILHEEELAIWLRFNPPNAETEAAAREAAAQAAAEAARRRRELGLDVWHSPTPQSEVPVFGDPANEYEKFSPDVDWMPNTVLIAKSTYVWLAQLSKRHGYPIYRLDQIPDEELDALAQRGMNSLWLIGVWERSRASQTIKRLCGNPDAVASAYSLYDYRIADDLGGEAAYINLRDRAYHRGIRLASDMVPNHMGIDSPWVVEHPDWFLSRPVPPYPAYNFEGPDLSADPRVEIRIEKHYYNQTDAAVTFERRDRRTGETRFIYHGNDGTSFPWNDTAQLNYLNPDVREQVIQTILHVARLFPVIRFDAAMTLAKRHFHRLWFPGPGASGAIPSRAEDGMSDAEFNAIMPQEFWREVVDRVAAEVPGTLLLAEAFWLMEGYFVRTLGMHRVYNSAFMNMMRDEKNAEYRAVLKNTLEFDPDIMKRYVNFMSNPDERTAIDQFGKGDKCFGVAAVMATLPGLPMFGHGQVEGYTEKYGMEYRWPRYDETPEPWLVERHQRQIAPLLHNRSLFAESHNFLLYDFFTASGTVDENVFAYSNRRGEQRGVVVYNNRYGETHGTIHLSAAFADKHAGGLRQVSLKDGLGVASEYGVILAYRDSLSGLSYLRRGSALSGQGLTLSLHAYQCHIFVEWRELRSTAEWPWDRLCDHLNGRGVADLDEELINLTLWPVHDALRKALEPGLVRALAQLAVVRTGARENPERWKRFEKELSSFFDAAWRRVETFIREGQLAYAARGGASAAPCAPRQMTAKFRARVAAALGIPDLEGRFPKVWTAGARRVLPSASPQLEGASMWGPVLSWCLLEVLAESIDQENVERVALDLFDRLRLRQPLGEALATLGFASEENWRVAGRIKVALLVTSGAVEAGLAETEETEPTLSAALWQDPDIRWLTGVHEAGEHTYFRRESYEDLLWWLKLPTLYRLAGEAAPSRRAMAEMSRTVVADLEAAEAAGYRLDVLLKSEEPANLAEPAVPVTPAEIAAATVVALDVADEPVSVPARLEL